MRFGCALPADLFGENHSASTSLLCKSFGGKNALLAFCAEQFDCVELRTVPQSADPQYVADAVSSLHARGLGVTIHGTLAKVTDAESFFAPYRLILEQRLQSVYNITVHPLAERSATESLLKQICLAAQKEELPVFITLENQRIKEQACESGLCADVADLVQKINSPYLGVCFDFGHSLSNERKFHCDEPDDTFYSLVRHTHVHSLGKRTHFPLGEGEALLERNLNALFEKGFDGVLSLELSADRFAEFFDVREAFMQSAHILKRAAAQVERKRETLSLYREDYGFILKDMQKSFEEKECLIGLLGPASYVLRLGKLRVGVDVCIWDLPIPQTDKDALTSWLATFDLLIVTHAHGDHYDKALLKALPENVVRLVPSFIACDAPNVVRVADGDIYEQSGVRFTFFTSAHKSIEECGFAITYQGEHYVFPIDVRDYDAPTPIFENTRALFAHLWLGKANALCLKGNVDEKFCAFVQRFGAESVYCAHLFDTRRTIHDMWTDVHFDLVKDRLGDAHPMAIGDLLAFI